MDIDSLKSRARKLRPDLPTDDVIDAIEVLYTGEGTVFSPSTIIERTHLEPRRVLSALLLLVDEPLRLLRGDWSLHLDGGSVSLATEDLQDFVAGRGYLHPTTGERVPDFEERVVLSYTVVSWAGEPAPQ